MPNQLTALGLETATRAEIIAYYTAQFQAIYGTDINLDQDSPDGQIMNIFVQSVLDMQDLLRQIYNSFDPDTAIGVVLDQRVALNGIQRQEGTFTLTNVTIVTNQALTLYGLDQTLQPVYTVADAAGNQWNLINTTVISGAGTSVAAFRAATPGANLTVPNTITIPVTIVLGVVSVNNPTTYTTLGFNEESDGALRIRRQKSVSLASQGYLSALLAALQNTAGVTFAAVFENVTGITDGDGLPGHSIWVIVAGTATSADIANAIYTKRNAGCGMFGAQTFTITQVDGSQFQIFWDIVQAENLFIEFEASSLDGITPPDINAIRTQLVTRFVPGVNEQVNINDLATIVQDIDPNCLVTAAGFNTAATGVFSPTLSPTAKNKQFAVSAHNIIITPMLLLPFTSTVLANGSKQFAAYGGFGTYTYSMIANPSGGSINSVSGLYTAGPTGSVIDSVQVTDAHGNTADATIQVT